jgi:hypothetical protein
VCIAVAMPPHDGTYEVVTIGAVAMEKVRQLVMMGRAGPCPRCSLALLPVIHWFGPGKGSE